MCAGPQFAAAAGICVPPGVGVRYSLLEVLWRDLWSNSRKVHVILAVQAGFLRGYTTRLPLRGTVGGLAASVR